MNHVSNMASLAVQAVSGLTHMLPVTLVLALVASCGLVWDISSKRLRFGSRLSYLLLPCCGSHSHTSRWQPFRGAAPVFILAACLLCDWYWPRHCCGCATPPAWVSSIS